MLRSCVFLFRFILITHNSDLSVPYHIYDKQLLEHPLLIRWFSKNIDAEYKDHMKMEALPIGLKNPRISKQYNERNHVFDIEPYLG